MNFGRRYILDVLHEKDKNKRDNELSKSVRRESRDRDSGTNKDQDIKRKKHDPILEQ